MLEERSRGEKPFVCLPPPPQHYDLTETKESAELQHLGSERGPKRPFFSYSRTPDISEVNPVGNLPLRVIGTLTPSLVLQCGERERPRLMQKN